MTPPRDIVYDVATTIQRPIDDVARYLFDPRTMPEWSAVLIAVEDPDDQPLHRRGRRLKANLQFLGVSMTMEGELVGLDLEARRGSIVVRPVDGDGEIVHELQLEDRGHATVVHFRNRVTPPTWLAESVSHGFLQTYVEAAAHFALGMVRAVLHAGEEDGIRRAQERAAAVVPPPEPL